MRSYPDCDLAFIKTDINGNHFADFKSATALRVGRKVFAIGHPIGLKNTLTQGVVSSIQRLLAGTQYIQTDAPINPGAEEVAVAPRRSGPCCHSGGTGCA